MHKESGVLSFFQKICRLTSAISKERSLKNSLEWVSFCPDHRVYWTLRALKDSSLSTWRATSIFPTRKRSRSSPPTLVMFYTKLLEKTSAKEC